MPHGPVHLAHHQRRGFTLMEALMSLTIVAVLAAVVIPAMGRDDRARLIAGAGILRSDIELAQAMTVAFPDEPVIVVFDPPQARYWLAYADDPATPIARFDTGAPYLVTFGEGRARAAAEVTFTLQDVPDYTLEFSAQGGLDDFTLEPVITLSVEGATLQLQIAPTTGSIAETTGP